MILIETHEWATGELTASDDLAAWSAGSPADKPNRRKLEILSCLARDLVEPNEFERVLRTEILKVWHWVETV